MNELQNIKLQSNENQNQSYNISNKGIDSTKIKNLNNETFNEINFSTTNDSVFKFSDTLYGNNYLKYYLNDKYSSSKMCFSSKIKKMGNYYVYLFCGEQPLIAIGNKKKSLVIIYEIILQISFLLLMFTIINSIPIYMKYILISLYLNCFLCHMYIFLINPGIPNIDHYSKIFLKSQNYMKMGEEQKKNYYLCEICNIVINYSEDVEHCEDCDICVEKYDHHCYWTGKCISKKNIWAFYFFSFGTLIYILWYFTIIIYWIRIKANHATTSKKKFL